MAFKNLVCFSGKRNTQTFDSNNCCDSQIRKPNERIGNEITSSDKRNSWLKQFLGVNSMQQNLMVKLIVCTNWSV